MEYYLKAMKITEDKLGINHLKTALSYSSIANIYYNLGLYDKCMEYNLKAMKIREEKLGINHIETA